MAITGGKKNQVTMKSTTTACGTILCCFKTGRESNTLKNILTSTAAQALGVGPAATGELTSPEVTVLMCVVGKSWSQGGTWWHTCPGTWKARAAINLRPVWKT